MDWLDHATYLYSSVVAAGTGAVYLFNLTDYIYSVPLTCCALPYFVLDFVHCKPSNKIHHVCVAWLVLGMLREPHPAISMYMYKIELSTLLYNAIPYVPRAVKGPLTLVFIAAFTKTRVWEGYFFLKSVESELQGSLLRVPLCALYAVNLYWFSLMLRNMCKHRAKGPRYVNMCQQIAAFSYLGAIPATATCPPVLAVHACTAVTSFGYHYCNAVGRPSLFWFVADSAAVHAVMVMNVYIAARACLSWSLATNAYFFLLRVSNDPSEAITFSSISLLIDSLFILGGEASNLFKLDYALHLYLICLIFYVDFFNDLTYVCFHVLMWFNAHAFVSLL